MGILIHLTGRKDAIIQSRLCSISDAVQWSGLCNEVPAANGTDGTQKGTETLDLITSSRTLMSRA